MTTTPKQEIESSELIHNNPAHVFKSYLIVKSSKGRGRVMLAGIGLGFLIGMCLRYFVMVF